MDIGMRELVDEVINSHELTMAIRDASSAMITDVEGRLEYDIMRVSNSCIDENTARIIAYDVAEETMRDRVKTAVMDILKEIGIVDEHYRAHEPSEVNESDFGNVVLNQIRST